MLQYQLMGSSPSVFPASLLPRIAKACRRIPGFGGSRTQSVGLRFLSEHRMKELNRAYRGKNCPTDVLSFHAADRMHDQFPAVAAKGEEEEVGDIVICAAVAKREAARRSISAREELVRLIVHGTLHLAGHDHARPADEVKMFRLQEMIVESVV
ncbi:rRNA maturation RNase YbeY [candidate division WWE3 bacterium]|uniref:Endoribonuclease YbeY n=1 Tax=candidate division WWE3 bacterium TaxID=2053526 RepID=A0A928TQP2_UNCKA|nr:rRNA maturation RNase YbeY [candidate division WWE3 bacterium]